MLDVLHQAPGHAAHLRDGEAQPPSDEDEDLRLIEKYKGEDCYVMWDVTHLVDNIVNGPEVRRPVGVTQTSLEGKQAGDHIEEVI